MSNAVSGHNAFEPLQLFIGWGEVWLLETFRHVLYKFALLRIDPSAIDGDTIEVAVQRLRLLEQEVLFGRGKFIFDGPRFVMRLMCFRMLPFIVCSFISIPGTQAG